VVYSYFFPLLPLFFHVEDFHCVLHVSLFASCVQDLSSITRHSLIFMYGVQVLFEPGLNIHLVWLTCLGGNLSSSFSKHNYFQIYIGFLTV
jgi:hypothetical protein